MDEKLVLISGYGAPGQEDLVLYRMDGAGKLLKLQGLHHGRAPSFCCLESSGRIYVASERPDGADISAYELCGDGLVLLRTMKVPGKELCHLYSSGTVVYGCCYGSGHYFAVDAELTKVLWEFCPGHAHAHWAQAVGEMLYLADLGNDCLYRCRLEGDLPASEPEVLPQQQGSGPRQILPLGDGNLLCVNELGGTLRVLSPDNGVMCQEKASGSVMTENYPGGACTDGRGRLYVCNRGPNTIAAWNWDGRALTMQKRWQTGNWPRFVTAIPETPILAVACHRSSEVIGYRMEGTEACELFRISHPGASCILVI